MTHFCLAERAARQASLGDRVHRAPDIHQLQPCSDADSLRRSQRSYRSTSSTDCTIVLPYSHPAVLSDVCGADDTVDPGQRLDSLIGAWSCWIGMDARLQVPTACVAGAALS